MNIFLIRQFDYFAQTSPSKAAIVHGNIAMTYQYLQSKVNALAFHLLKSGLQKEEIVGLYFERSPYMIVAMLAVIKAGGAFLPISPHIPEARFNCITEDSGIRFLITDKTTQNKIPSTFKKHIVVASIDSQDVQIKTSDFPSIAESDLAYVMYTSGSTGKPKGVLIEHGALEHIFRHLESQIGFSASDHFLALTDYTFDVSLIELLLPLSIGATIVLTNQGTIVDGSKIISYLKKYNITVMQATPITWEMLLRAEWKNDGTMKVLSGGEALSTELALLLDSQKDNVWNLCGPTETTLWSLAYKVALNQNQMLITQPIGLPIGDTIVHVWDEGLQDVAQGEQGELYIGGSGVARGYLNRDELTKKVFITTASGQRLYKTGDIVKVLPDGNIQYLCRNDEQIKVGGIRIEPREIEVLIEQVPMVKKAIVKTHSYSEYCKQIVAFVELNEKLVFKTKSHQFNDVVDDWQRVYENVYQDAHDHEYAEVNTSGWVNSFTRKPFLPEELAEWQSCLLNSMNGSDLSDILEIGSGTGALLQKLIDRADSYTATEISTKALDYISSHLKKEVQSKVILKQMAAHDIKTGIHQYSCIIVNSVVQYFPSSNYLIEVLRNMVSAVKDGGQIVVGDVRAIEFYELLLLERKMHYKSQGFDPEISSFFFKNREQELLVSPKFFFALQQMIPEITYVDLSIKHGNFQNELNGYRYDIILHINKPVIYQEGIDLEWQDITLDKLKYLLSTGSIKLIRVKRVPNAYFTRIIDKLRKVFANELRMIVEETFLSSEFDVNELNDLCQQWSQKWQVYMSYDFDRPLQYVELNFYPVNQNGKQLIRERNCLVDYSMDLDRFVREPYDIQCQQQVFNRIEKQITEFLPTNLLPTAYTWIERWPTTLNGKLDRKALTLQGQPLQQPRLDQEIASTSIINQLLELWFKVTRYSVLAIEYDLKYAPISSLYVHYFLAEITKRLGVKVCYREFLVNSSIEKLANLIARQLGAASSPDVEDPSHQEQVVELASEINMKAKKEPQFQQKAIEHEDDIDMLPHSSCRYSYWSGSVDEEGVRLKEDRPSYFCSKPVFAKSNGIVFNSPSSS